MVYLQAHGWIYNNWGNTSSKKILSTFLNIFMKIIFWDPYN